VNKVFYSKDFIQTAEGLVFAVVDNRLEQGKVLCFLRYKQQASTWIKLATDAANQLLKKNYPHYLFYSEEKSAHLHAVSVEDITRHYQPKSCLQAILSLEKPDIIQRDLISLCGLFVEQGIQCSELGITGSLIIGAQKQSSDIDLLVYDRVLFHQLRAFIKQLIIDDALQALDEQAWCDSYQRRSCDLSYDDYVWHEQRKLNKALINGRKFDLSLVVSESTQETYQKQGKRTLQARVIDAQYAFDYPARFIIEHKEIAEVVCFTATYTGQAELGEQIDVSGMLEVSSSGVCRLIVGSSREAAGEYIKVI